MIDPEKFALRQAELATEFAKFLVEHPEVDDSLPMESYIYFEIQDEPDFNEYSRQLAERRQRQEEMVPVCVRVKGIAPPQGSRLIEPQIVPGAELTTSHP